MSVYYDHQNEMWLIGAFLQDSNTWPTLDALDVEDFHGAENRLAVAVLKEMRSKKLAIDVSAAGTYCDALDGMHLIACGRACPSTVTLDTHVDILRDMRRKRDLYMGAKALMDSLNAGEDADKASDALRDRLRSQYSGDETVSLADVARRTYDDLERRSAGEIVSIQTGLPDLDGVLCGLTNSELILLGARPGVGKSALAMEIAVNAGEKGKRVLVCSREMSDIQYGQRIFSRYGDVSVSKMRAGRLEPEEWARVSDAANKASGLPLRFAFQTRSVEGLRRVCQREKDLYGLDMLCVDYLQLMGTSRSNDNEAVRLGYISMALKEIAMEYNIPVLALAQVNRQDSSADTLPTLKELKGSGNLEQDADVVIFLHHPAKESDKSIAASDKPTYKALEERGEQYVVVKVAKQRQGQQAKFGVEFDPSRMKYTCLYRGG